MVICRKVSEKWTPNSARWRSYTKSCIQNGTKSFPWTRSGPKVINAHCPSLISASQLPDAPGPGLAECAERLNYKSYLFGRIVVQWWKRKIRNFMPTWRSAVCTWNLHENMEACEHYTIQKERNIGLLRYFQTFVRIGEPDHSTSGQGATKRFLRTLAPENLERSALIYLESI